MPLRMSTHGRTFTQQYHGWCHDAIRFLGHGRTLMGYDCYENNLSAPRCGRRLEALVNGQQEGDTVNNDETDSFSGGNNIPAPA